LLNIEYVSGRIGSKMSEKESEFDALVKLYTEIKSFKIDNSAKILKNFHSENQPKFKLTAEEKEEEFLFSTANKELKTALEGKKTQKVKKAFKTLVSEQSHPKIGKNFLLSGNVTITEGGKDGWTITDSEKTFIVVESGNELKVYRGKPSRLNLSSTAVCAYALSQYLELWDEDKKTEYKAEFPNLRLFSMDVKSEDALNNKEKRKLQDEFEKNGFSFLGNLSIEPEKDNKWTVTDDQRIFVVKKEEEMLKVYRNFKLKDYYTFITVGLDRYLDKSSGNSELESTDEFSLLNILSLLKGIQKAVKKETCLFSISVSAELEDELNKNSSFVVPEELKKKFETNGFQLPKTTNMSGKENEWLITNENAFIVRKEDGKLNIYKKNKDFEDLEKGSNVVIKIIRMLCKQFFKNNFSSFGERPHPFIYYKFMHIIQDWTPEIFNDIKDYKNEWTSQKEEEWELNYFVDVVEKEGSKAIFDCFFSEAKIYDDAKYEMYRQIALHNAADLSLFDVKRLIYSLLIAKMNDKYSNNLIKDEVLKLIFDEQLDTNTGLFPIGHVVNTDFVIEGGVIKDKKERIISASPMLSSVECLKDMLTHEELKTDLEKYQEKLNSTYEWIIKRLRKDSSGNSLGWFPEYESTHTPESWVAGHTLIFLKRYCEMLSELIKKNAGKELQAKEPEELDIEWEKLYDSYEVKKYIGYMTKEEEKGKVVSKPEYRSALIFGPPGSGKSTVVKALAKRLGWHYVELSPGIFFEGERNIIPNATKIFKRLVRMKETVIFFDEVDQLVKAREKGVESSIWIVTSLLPLFQDLREQKDIKFILATNNITEVDTAARRPGRIDAVLPMGALCWQDRLKILRDAINDGNNRIKELRSNEPNEIFKDLLKGDELKNDEQIDEMEEDKIKNLRLRKFLERTDFMPLVELNSIVERLFNKEDWEKVEKAESYKVLFGKEGSGSENYENSEFEDFHENLVGKSKDKDKHVDKYVHLPMEAEISKDAYIQKVKKSIFGER